ncbi:MAG: DUF2934 domain-containing protein [Pseudomonas sp.]|uniref:DUF2934 domain-containing protein n=1 Tax=Pseudomonas sp. TaxID=306 RepID=UPI00339534D2
MTVDEQRIRDFAYQIWESEGCPEGQEQRHWQMAIKLAEAAEAAASAAPAVKRARKVKTAEVVQAPAPTTASKPGNEPPALLKPSKKTAKTPPLDQSTP